MPPKIQIINVGGMDLEFPADWSVKRIEQEIQGNASLQAMIASAQEVGAPPPGQQQPQGQPPVIEMGRDETGAFVPEGVGETSLQEAIDAVKAGIVGLMQGGSGQSLDEVLGYAGRMGTPLAGGWQGPVPRDDLRMIRDEARRLENEAAAANPGAYWGSQVAGAMAGGGKLASAVGAGTKLSAMVPRVAGAEAGLGAWSSGFGQGGDVPTNLPGIGRFTGRMAGSALIGGAVGGGTPLVAHGVGSLSRRVSGAERRVARAISKDMKRKGLTPEEYVAPLRRDPKNLRVMDVSQGTREMMGTSAFVEHGVAGRVRNLIDQRAKGQGDRIERGLRKDFGKKTSLERIRSKWEETREFVRPRYDAINETIVEPTDDVVDTLLNTRTGRKALERAKELAENERRPFTFGDELLEGVDPLEGGVSTTLSGRDLDFIQRAFRQLATEADAAAQSGKSATGTLGGSYREVRKRFLDDVDAQLPGFKETRQKWASTAEISDAEDIGRGFFSGKLSQIKDQWEDLSDVQKEYAAYSFVEDVIDRVVNTGDATSLVNQFGRKKIREIMKLTLGKKASKNYINRLEVEDMMEQLKTTVGRPPTSPNAVREEGAQATQSYLGGWAWRMKVLLMQRLFTNPRQARTARAFEKLLDTSDPEPMLSAVQGVRTRRPATRAGTSTAGISQIAVGLGNRLAEVYGE